MENYLMVALGGAIGSVARFGTSGLVFRYFGGTFPWSTLVENILGSFVIGIAAALAYTEGRWMIGQSTRIFIMVGLCGGYTTFSSFSLETLALMRNGEWIYAGTNVFFSVAMCILAVWLGQTAAAALR
jgi:CrcB protein